jgi:pimeloyl-ACP methyl ester carboxylesterase
MTTLTTVSGDELHFDDVPGPDGAPVIVWAHGFLLSAVSYTEVIAKLPDFRHIIADLRGHGRSAGTASDTTLSRMADDIWEITQSLDVPEFTIIGHSMGNAVAVRLAAKHPAAVVAGVSLAGIPVSGKREEAREGVAAMVELAGDAQQLADALAGLFVHEDPSSPMVVSAGHEASLVPRQGVAEVVHRQFFLDESATLLPSLTQPWLFLVPSADATEPPAYQLSQAELLPNSHVVVLEDEGHMFPQERPELAAHHIGTFLTSLRR